MRFFEIKAVTNIDKGEKIYIPASDHKKATYETKIKGYKIYHAKSKLGPMPIEHFLVKDPESNGFLGELKLTVFYKYYSSDVFFNPRIQGKGIALPLYAYVVKKGYTLVSDREQSRGSQTIWKKLSQLPGIFVYAWDRKYDEFFQWNPEEEADDAIYQDKNDIRLVAIASKQETNENFADGKVNYTMPNLDYEWEEAQRYPALAKLGSEGWKKLKGKKVNVKDLGGLQKIGNHSAPDQNTANKNLPNLEPVKVKRTQAMVKRGQIELPIVVKLPNGKMDLLGGNTRFTSLVAMGIIPNVWYIDASGLKENFDWVKLRTAKAVQPMLYYPGGIDPKTGKRVPPNVNQPNIITAVNLKQKLGPGEKLVPLSTRSMTDDQWKKYMDDWWAKNKNDPNAKAKIDQIKQSASMVKENFADGKKPGRKGLAKRSGVDCKQSVSKLRSIAKSSSGEKQRMAHWCANMKSGRNK